MQTTINLNAELRKWLNGRLNETLADNPDNIHHIVLTVNEAKDDIFRLVYDYQVSRNWPSVAINSADILGLSEMHIYRLAKKMCKNRN